MRLDQILNDSNANKRNSNGIKQFHLNSFLSSKYLGELGALGKRRRDRRMASRIVRLKRLTEKLSCQSLTENQSVSDPESGER